MHLSQLGLPYQRKPLTTLAVKDYRKRLQVCVSANGGHFKHLM